MINIDKNVWCVKLVDIHVGNGQYRLVWSVALTKLNVLQPNKLLEVPLGQSGK